MKRLLNDPVMNDTGWPDHNKKVKRETDLQSDNRGTGPKRHPFRYWHPILDGTMALSTRVGPSVQLTEPIRPTKAIKQMRDRPIYIGTSKKWACLHWLPTRQTRIAIVLTFSSVHGVALSLVHEVTLSAMCIKPTKLLPLSGWISSLQDLLSLLPENTKKSTRSPKTTKKLQLTWPLDSHSIWIAWTPSAGVERTQGYPTTKKSEPQSFGFLFQFLTKFKRFFI